RLENSPAVHCRVQFRNSNSPEGTAESSVYHATVPIPVCMATTRPSLRDSILLFGNPSLDSVGYSRISLREMAAQEPLVFDVFSGPSATGGLLFLAGPAPDASPTGRLRSERPSGERLGRGASTRCASSPRRASRPGKETTAR